MELARSSPQRPGVEASFRGGTSWRRIKLEPALWVVGVQSRTGSPGAASRQRCLQAGAGVGGRQGVQEAEGSSEPSPALLAKAPGIRHFRF